MIAADQGDETPSRRPGDEDQSGGRQTGEAVCPSCAGTGLLGGATCPQCLGTGRITAIVGDA